VGGGRETVEAAGESVTHARAQSVNIEQQSVTQARAKSDLKRRTEKEQGDVRGRRGGGGGNRATGGGGGRC